MPISPRSADGVDVGVRGLRGLRSAILAARDACRRLRVELLHERRTALPPRPNGVPHAETLRRDAERCRRILFDNIVPFFLPACVDRESGGYFEDEHAGVFVDRGERFVTMQARQLWFFARLACEGVASEGAAGVAAGEARAAADHGLCFLDRAFLDRDRGGYFRTWREGRAADTRKSLYDNSFVLFALARHHLATGDERSRAAAMALFATLEEKARDARIGGYTELADAAWLAVSSREAYREGLLGARTLNGHIHLLEALVELHAATGEPLVRARLAEVVTLLTLAFQHPQHACTVNAWDGAWRMAGNSQNLRASYGHDLELVWLVLDAARRLDLPVAMYKGWSLRLADHALRHGYDRRHGGMFFSGPFGRAADDRRKEWWVQAEALVALLELFALTGDAGFYRAFDATLSFVETCQLAPGGGWWATCRADGRPLVRTRATRWQGAYHTGRSMLACVDRLQRLASGSS